MRHGPLFLERRSYRRRRMMDALRFLPFLGLGLWMVPLLWPLNGGTEAALATSATLKYVFGIWVLLILAALFLGRRSGDPAGSEPR